jgi:hypothetical protein
MLKTWVYLEGQYENKERDTISVLHFSWAKHPVRTKDILKTLNRVGDIFTFKPQYLLQNQVINKLEMLYLLGLRKKYGRIKACLLELK